MKIAIFSDTHLRLPFEERKFKFLERVIKNVERIIINGDFWDGYTGRKSTKKIILPTRALLVEALVNILL